VPPYIDRPSRTALDSDARCPQTAGELNYAITRLCNDYLALCGTSYQTYNDIVGALEGCKLEVYRRQVAPYEDDKIDQNGDVF